ncbi:MAG: hypothetical protein WC346_09905 [Methanogenium sp.]|jgi:hypothetical protein
MKIKRRAWALSVLLAVMLVSVVMVPVSAETQRDAGIDFEQYTIPELKEDRSLETIAISGMLSPDVEQGKTELGTYGIPFGSIIVHTAEGTTQIFDQNGKQLLSINDELSEKTPTPAGVEKPCTKVHQLPNDSRLYHHGNEIYVLDPAGKLILIIIDEVVSSDQKNGTTTRWIGNDWIESAEDYLNYITENVAYWSVPTSPPSIASNEMIYLFNSITGVSGSKKYILQPVLCYYGANQRWEGQAWACDVYGDDNFVGPLFNTVTGNTMKGRVYWSSSLQIWSITLYDMTTGQYSSVSTNCIVPQSNSRVALALEGWNIEDNTDVPGDTLFYDIVSKSYGTPMSVDLDSWYSTSIPYEIMRYCWVEFIQNPTQVQLNTYN